MNLAYFHIWEALLEKKTPGLSGLVIYDVCNCKRETTFFLGWSEKIVYQLCMIFGVLLSGYDILKLT